MSQITIIHNPSEATLKAQNVYDWPIWQKEVSEFPWSYDMEEVCYVLAGEVIVTPEYCEPVKIQAGDMVTFPKGMNFHWLIKQDIKKHYQFL